MLFLIGWKSAAKVGRGVAVGPAGSDGITEDLAAVLFCPVGGIEGAFVFEPSQAGKEFRRRDGADGFVADPWKNVEF